MSAERIAFVTGCDDLIGVGCGVVEELIASKRYKTIIVHHAFPKKKGFYDPLTLKAPGVEIIPLQASFLEMSEVRRLAQEVIAAVNPRKIDTIVHVAGITETQDWWETPSEEMGPSIRIGCLAADELNRVIAKRSMSDNNPHIVVVSTNHVGSGATGVNLAYAGSKSFLGQSVPGWNQNLKSSGIRVNIVKLGWTECQRHLTADAANEIDLKKVAASLPTGRINQYVAAGRAVIYFETETGCVGTDILVDNGAGISFPGC